MRTTAVQITSRRVTLIIASLLVLLFSQLPRTVAESAVSRALGTTRAAAQGVSAPFVIPSSGVLPQSACGYGSFRCPAHPAIDIWTLASGLGTETDSCGGLTRGNPVYAAYDGTVVGIRDVSSLKPGDPEYDGVPAMVILQHDIDPAFQEIVPQLKVYTLYTHMASALPCNDSFVRKDLKVGDKVKQDELLGYQGNRPRPGTGDSTKTHLHFQVDAVGGAQAGECDKHLDPSPYLGVDCTVCPQVFTRAESRDATLISSPSTLTLTPGEQSQLVFDIQNTGTVSWQPGQGYALINTNEESLGALPVQVLETEISPGSIAHWVVPITAPAQIGLNWTEWRMAHDGEPFGDTATCLVAVVPEGEIDIDVGALLAQWLDELGEEILDRFDQFLQDLADRFEEWLQRESERLLSELLESLSQQCCGAIVVAPAALLLVGWTSARRRRKRMGDRDRD